MTAPTHTCPGCGTPGIVRSKLSCRACWYRLPRDLRQPVSDNYRRNPAAHVDALGDALRWYREHPLTTGTDSRIEIEYDSTTGQRRDRTYRLSTCSRCGGSIERRPGAVAGWGHLTDTPANEDGHQPVPDDSWVDRA